MSDMRIPNPEESRDIARTIVADRRHLVHVQAARTARRERLRSYLVHLGRCTPGQAAEAILEEWRLTFGPRRARDAGPAEFTPATYTDTVLSRRMGRLKSCTFRRRHVPYGPEAGVN